MFAGHITDERITINHSRPEQALSPAILLSVEPERLADSGETYRPGQPDDLVISARCVQQALDAVLEPMVAGQRAAVLACFGQAVAIRTLPNDETKKTKNYTGTNPPYFTEGAMRLLRSLGVVRLLNDLPSVDRSDDQGLLLAHRAFWDLDVRRNTHLGASSPCVGHTLRLVLDL